MTDEECALSQRLCDQMERHSLAWIPGMCVWELTRGQVRIITAIEGVADGDGIVGNPRWTRISEYKWAPQLIDLADPLTRLGVLLWVREVYGDDEITTVPSVSGSDWYVCFRSDGHGRPAGHCETEALIVALEVAEVRNDD